MNKQMADTLMKQLEDLTTNQQEIIKLKVYLKSANIAAFLTVKTILLIVICFGVLTLTIGVSLWLGELLGKSYYGFFIITVIYTIAAIFLRSSILKNIQLYVNNLLLSKLLDEENT